MICCNVCDHRAFAVLLLLLAFTSLGAVAQAPPVPIFPARWTTLIAAKFPEQLLVSSRQYYDYNIQKYREDEAHASPSFFPPYCAVQFFFDYSIRPTSFTQVLLVAGNVSVSTSQPFGNLTLAPPTFLQTNTSYQGSLIYNSISVDVYSGYGTLRFGPPLLSPAQNDLSWTLYVDTTNPKSAAPVFLWTPYFELQFLEFVSVDNPFPASVFAIPSL